MATLNEPEKQPAADLPETVATECSPTAKPSMTSERLAVEMARLDRWLVLAVLAFAFLLGSFTARNSDFWMHLATGRALAQGQYTFGTDPFAYTTAGVYWANHSWLFDWLLYGFTTALGGIDRPSTGTVLVAGKAFLVVLLAWVLLAIRRRNESVWLSAVCVGLGLLVLSPRLYLQPVMVSFLFLGLTLYVLARDGKPKRTPETRPLGVVLTSAPARLYALPPLFVLWVNLDSWFILGPVMVALYLIGEWLQEKLAPLRTADDSPQPGELRTQCYVLLLGSAACLVSPHHYRVWALPSDLFAMLRATGLRDDPAFRSLFISPLSKEYFMAPAGQNAAGLAYFVLVALGFFSFAINSAATRGWRTLVWLVFGLLSAANQRFIPFFAIVAGPITALNLQDYLADRRGAVSPQIESPSRRVLAAPGLSLLVLIVLIAGAWTGLLYAHADNPRYARRAAWTLEIDPSLRKAAEQLAAWRQLGQLPESSRGFASNPDLASYFAWFCPAEKGFFDYRYPLFAQSSGDYVKLRLWLGGQAQAGPGGKQSPSWERIFREHRIDHVILTGSAYNGLVVQMLQFPHEWTLLYLDGRTTVFGWNGVPQGAKDDRFRALKFDLSSRAFGPNPDRAPAKGLPRSPQPTSDWNLSWQPPVPTSLDREEAAMVDLLYFDALKQQWQNARLRAALFSTIAGCVGAGALGADPAAPGGTLCLLERLKFAAPSRQNSGWPDRNSHAGYLVSHYLQGPDLGPPAAPLVALRAARRAVAANPDDADAHRTLALAVYYLWLYQENYWTGAGAPGPINPEQIAQLRQLMADRSVPIRSYLRPWITGTVSPRQLLRQVQVAVALQDFLFLRPGDAQAHEMLANLYWHMGYYDQALDHLREETKQLRAAAVPEDAARKKEHELRLGRKERLLKQVDEQVAELRNDYELHTDKLPPPQRRLVAFFRFGLAKLALTAFEQMPEAEMKQLSPQEADLYIYLLATMGQTRKAIEEGTGKPGVLPDNAELKKLLGARFSLRQAALSAAVGDYARAAKSLAEAQPPSSQSSRPPLADFLQAITFNRLQPHPLNHLIAVPFLQQQFQQALAAINQQQDVCNFLVLRGLVSLDEGDVDAARGHFRAAVQSGKMVPFESQPIALRYLRLLGDKGNQLPLRH